MRGLTLVSVCALSTSVLSQALNACPTTEVSYIDAKGGQWAICPNSDYQGASTTVTQNVANSNDCATICSNTNGCINGVYDKNGRICHAKARTGLNWVVNNQFNSMRFIKAGPAQGSAINGGCPYTETFMNTADGSQYALCPGTDFQGGSIYIVNGYPTFESCAGLCNQTPSCTNAVWDAQGGNCHIKRPRNDLNFVVNRNWNTIRTVNKATIPISAPRTGGRWSDVKQIPLVPAAGFVVPAQPRSSEIMVFSSTQDKAFGGGRLGSTQYVTYNYINGAVSHYTVANTQHDMFCPGMSVLQDGRMVIGGGNDAKTTTIYDPWTKQFTRSADMQIARGYQAQTILSNGKIFTIGGSYSGGFGGKTGELFNPTNGQWTTIANDVTGPMETQDKEGIWREDNHGWLHAWSNGFVLQAGPSRAMNWYNTNGAGGIRAAGTRDNKDAMCGINVMYDTGKILSAGGSQDYDASAAYTTAHILTLGQANQAVQVEQVSDMKFQRGFANSVVTPDGSVIVFGGQRTSRVFTDLDSVLFPEMFNPQTKSWTTLNANKVSRNYHSMALLLGDGTVFVGGGGLCYVVNNQNQVNCDDSANHNDFEIFSPPYLYNQDGSLATRPVINDVDTSQTYTNNYVNVGGQLYVTMAQTGNYKFSLVRMGSVTHSTNTDQRRLSLTATFSNNRYNINLPTDSGILLPGYWWLFATNDNGTPSVGYVLQVRI